MALAHCPVCGCDELRKDEVFDRGAAGSGFLKATRGFGKLVGTRRTRERAQEQLGDYFFRRLSVGG